MSLMKSPLSKKNHNPDNYLSAKDSRELAWLMLYICLAYHYKVLFCGFLGKICGFTWICYTLIHGITTNHWFEHFVYVPVLWYVLYRVVVIVFNSRENKALSDSLQKQKTVALFLATMYIYATGMHLVNTLEIYSREYLIISSGQLYDQIFWLDELMSHWVQFFFYFLFFAWIIVYDRLDRTDGGYVAIFTGLLHGLERAVGVIEGNNPYSSIIFGSWILIACFIRWKKHERDFKRVWKDFFFRHGLSFGISMPIALYFYQIVFDGFTQPSSMNGNAYLVVIFALLFIFFGFLISMLVDYIVEKRYKA